MDITFGLIIIFSVGSSMTFDCRVSCCIINLKIVSKFVISWFNGYVRAVVSYDICVCMYTVGCGLIQLMCLRT